MVCFNNKISKIMVLLDCHRVVTWDLYFLA